MGEFKIFLILHTKNPKKLELIRVGGNEIHIVVGDCIITKKSTFLFKFWLFTSSIRITRLQAVSESQGYKQYPNHKVTSNLREVFKWLLLFVYMFLCVSILFKSLIKTKIVIESRLHCINICDEQVYFSDEQRVYFLQKWRSNNRKFTSTLCLRWRP